MKKVFLIFSVIFLLAITQVWAQPGFGPHHERKMNALNLTEEQEGKLTDMRLSHQKEMLPLRTKLQSLKADLKLQMTADKFDKGQVEKMSKEMSRVREEMQMKRIAHQRAVRDMLTPEQKKIFDSQILSGSGPGKHFKKGRMGQPEMHRRHQRNW